MAAAVDQAWRDAACLERKLLMAGAFAGLRHEIRVTGGPPADVLPEIMAEKGIDLLVMGTHGRSGLSKFFLGSCAEMMLRMAPCPVLTVGPNVTLPDNPESPFHHILLATDLSAAAERAARYALALAGEAKALLTVLHVLEAVPQEVCDRAVVVKSVKTRLQQWLELAGGSAQETRILAEFGALTETILGVAERGVSDLIVMGTHAPGVADEFLKWQNAYKIVCESSCPVLTVRALKD
jgi:nucleotide-binding universal stress UspA family protein